LLTQHPEITNRAASNAAHSTARDIRAIKILGVWTRSEPHGHENVKVCTYRIRNYGSVIADSSFKAAGIMNDSMKYGYTLMATNSRYSVKVRDIIMNPSENCAYEILKLELIKRISSMQEQKTRRLLGHEEIGDRKPSQFLRHLRNLATQSVIIFCELVEPPTRVSSAALDDTNSQSFRLAGGYCGRYCESDACLNATGHSNSTIFNLEQLWTRGSNLFRSKAKLAQLRLTMQQEMAEQMTTIRRSIEAIVESD